MPDNLKAAVVRTAFAIDGRAALHRGYRELARHYGNATYMPDAWRDMLRMSRASAFYGRKSSLDGIAKGTPIALYHTGVGMIALGKVTSERRIADVDGDEGEEHYVECAFEYTIDPEKAPERAVKAWEINEQLQASHRFRQTVYTLPGEALQFIRKRFAEKGATPGKP